ARPRGVRCGGADPRAERLAVRARRVPAPHHGVDRAYRRHLPAPRDSPAALARVGLRPRADAGRARGLPLCRPGPGPDLRAPVPARRRAAPVRRLLAVALAALVFPAAASAHATLTKTQPQYGTRVEQSPRVVRLEFDQTVDALTNAIKVYTADGKLLSGRTHITTAGRVMLAPVSRLARGGYTVRWQAISADGHVVSGVFTFGVRQKAPSASDAFGAGGPTTEEHAVRWLYFVALALLAGGLGFRLLIVRRPFAPAAQRRFYQVVGVGVVGAL